MRKIIFHTFSTMVATAFLVSCSSSPTPYDRGPATFRGPAAGPRAYRIYATAGAYGLAWGCENQLTDFERMDYDDAYEQALIVKGGCKIQNHLINTYEDRIVKDLQDDQYWVVRSHGMNHSTRGISYLGELNSSTSSGRLSLYALESGGKWSSTEALFVSVLPDSDGAPISETPYFCANCTANAENEIVKALKWGNKLDKHSVSMDFEAAKANSNNEVIAKFSAEVPKSENGKYYQARALFRVEFDLVKKVFGLKFVKILSSSGN